LVESGGRLYGSTLQGGVFGLNIDGTGFTNLHSSEAVSAWGGGQPFGGLVLSGNTLYGAVSFGGTSNSGSVFGINVDGTGFTNLYNFTGGNDGYAPSCGLVLSSSTMYGTAWRGGAGGNGTIFKLNTDGTGFATVYTFSAGNQNSDGARPRSGLILLRNTLYGTSTTGGIWGQGTVFKLNTDGTGFQVLVSLDLLGSTLTPPFVQQNGTGANPNQLLLWGNTLYGTAIQGGYWGIGTIFSLKTNGADFKVLHHFTLVAGQPFTHINEDGEQPNALTLVGNTFYGTTFFGGSSGVGTVFSFSLPSPELTITPSERNVILSWPSDPPGYILQATTNLVSSVWATNLPAPVVINGQNTVTNPISGTQQFFRLSQ
jgi:uncharacterized repeat protein (TIGR03803 family)